LVLVIVRVIILTTHGALLVDGPVAVVIHVVARLGLARKHVGVVVVAIPWNLPGVPIRWHTETLKFQCISVAVFVQILVKSLTSLRVGFVDGSVAIVVHAIAAFFVC
jgi:hypothetical protein